MRSFLNSLPVDRTRLSPEGENLRYLAVQLEVCFVSRAKSTALLWTVSVSSQHTSVFVLSLFCQDSPYVGGLCAAWTEGGKTAAKRASYNYSPTSF